MSDIDGAAAPADSAPAPAEVASTPNPVSTLPEGQPEPDAKPEGKPEPKAKVEPESKKPISTREALQKAAAKVEADTKAQAKPEVKTEAKPVEKAQPVKTDAPPRDPEGKFAPKTDAKPGDAAVKTETVKPSHTADEPPARFSADAKAAWAAAPESVRAEVSRMQRELTQGFEKHRAAAERDSTVAEFHEMAKQGGTDLKTALSKYVGMEQLLRQDPMRGLEVICQNAGMSLKDIAAKVMGQSPEQNASAQDATIRELHDKIARLESNVGQVTQTFQQQRTDATHVEVTKFAGDHPRFEELADDIAFFLKSGRTKDLSEAYTLAERLNPAPAQASNQTASSAAPIDLTAQTEKGQKSITGSPNAGSNPAAQRPPTSIKESLKRAMAQAG